jgi:hypothetical protein
MALALLVPLARTAAAQEEEDAEALFQKGRRLLKDGQYEEACQLLQKSFDLHEGVATEFNLAECEEKLQHFSSAYRHYDHVRIVSATKNDDARAEVAGTRAEIAKARAASITVTVRQPAPNEELRVDGELVVVNGQGKASLLLDPGPHDLEARADKYLQFIQKFSLTSGAKVAMDVPPLRAAGAPTSTLPKVTPVVDPPKRAQPAVVSPTNSGISGSHVAGYILLGTGTAMVGGGAYFLLDANKTKRMLDEKCPNRVCTDANLQSTYTNAKTETTAGAALAIAGGVFLITGLGLLATPTNSGATSGRRVQFAPMLGAGTGGIAASGAF